MGAPDRFAGNPASCGAFITNCSLIFSLQPHTFTTEAAKVAYAITHLTERARLWGAEEWERAQSVWAGLLSTRQVQSSLPGAGQPAVPVAIGSISVSALSDVAPTNAAVASNCCYIVGGRTDTAIQLGNHEGMAVPVLVQPLLVLNYGRGTLC